MNAQLDKGLPGDPRFPERDYQWMDDLTKSKDKLLEWLESFKSQYNQYEQAWPTIEECELTLQKYNEIVQKVKIPIEIQKAKNAKAKDGSVLEYGLDYHLRNFGGAVSYPKEYKINFFYLFTLFLSNSLKKVFQEILDSLKEIMIG